MHSFSSLPSLYLLKRRLSNSLLVTILLVKVAGPKPKPSFSSSSGSGECNRIGEDLREREYLLLKSAEK